MNPRRSYDHQRQAMHCLDMLNALGGPFSTMVVLPTGGGKTYTASNWLLRNALAKRKKVLWIAHRHMLLDQAAESFRQYAFADMMPDVSSFTYRIISGLPAHHKASRISRSDDLLIASKDSLRSSFSKIEEWLAGQREMYLVVDEAHHATAKTYRNLIEQLKGAVPVVKIIGLTATPFRTLDAEKGLLSRIFTDGIVDGKPVRGESGIAYQIGLQDLINRQILSRPLIETCETDEMYGQDLGAKEIEHMQRLDSIPDKVAKQMVASKSRNKLIVETYANNQDKYGKTILFAVNIAHAIALKALLNDAGVAADIVVSQLRDDDTGRMRTRAENQRAIDGYVNGDIKVLINVNILTEGVDLPKTQSVFLARPTSSTILMTQMIGRGLRGVKAGGTAESHIVSFVDGWDERVAWTSPETLFSGNNQFDDENRKERERADLRAISISKIREFAAILDSSVDTSLLEGIPFIERIPVGMYVFVYTEQGEEESGLEGSDVSCQVMVYSSNQYAYERFVAALPNLVAGKGLEDVDFAPQQVLDDMVHTAERQFFSFDMVPPYRQKDVESILKYFVQFDAAPIFYTFDSIDREKLDVGVIAQEIVDKDMGPLAQTEYEDALWDEGDDNILRMFFGNKRNFKHAVSYEIRKITDPSLYRTVAQTVPAEQTSQTRALENADKSKDRGSSGESAPARVVEPSVAETAQPSLSDAMKTELSDMGLEKLSLETLVPSDDVLASFGVYTPHGFTKNPKTGMPFKKFGQQAKLITIGSVTSLYSLGCLVAQFDGEKRGRLLSYRIDGSIRNWSKPDQTLMHVTDLLAYAFGLECAPTFDEVLDLARDAKSGLSIYNISVAETEAEVKVASSDTPKVSVGISAKPGVSANQNKLTPAAPAQSRERENAQASEESAASKQVENMLHEVQKILGATSGVASHPAETETPRIAHAKTERDYNLLPHAPLSGYVRIPEKNDVISVNLHARIEQTDTAKLLYSDRLLVARFSDSEGLTLYEYGHGANVMGWFDASHNADVRDFAVRMLKHKANISTDWLRKKALEPDSGITAVRVNEIPKELPRENAAQSKQSESGQGNAVARTPVTPDPAQLGGDGEKKYLRMFPVSVYGKVMRSSRTIPCQSIVAITQAEKNSCRVFTKDGGEYSYPHPYWQSVREFAGHGLMVAEAGCMIRPECAQRVVNPTKPRVLLRGHSREFPVGQQALKALLQKRPDLK